MSTKDNGNTGSKAFGSIMVIVAVCTGLWALMGPTTQRIDHIADEVKGIKEQLQRSGACASQEQSRLAQMQERFRETVIMGLRMLRGVSLGELESRFGINGVTYYGAVLDRLLEQGMVEINTDRLRLTAQGLLLANSVMSELV